MPKNFILVPYCFGIIEQGGAVMAVLLVVEDDIVTNEAICEYMESAGHTTFSASDGEQGLAMAKSNPVDLVILDIMLPKMTGIEVLKKLRKDCSVPVLMLTALDDEHTQAASFDEQSDDYITKPFSMLLLGKRVTALLRRCGKSPELKQMQFGEVSVDFSGYTASDADGRIDITPKEIDLLKLLVEHKGMVLSRTQILDELWGYDTPIIDRTIDTYIKNLRKKLRLDCIITSRALDISTRKCHEKTKTVPENLYLYFYCHAGGYAGSAFIPVHFCAPNADQYQPLYGKRRDDGKQPQYRVDYPKRYFQGSAGFSDLFHYCFADLLPAFFQSHDGSDQADFQDHGTDGAAG